MIHESSSYQTINRNRFHIGTLVTGRNRVKIYKHIKNDISDRRLFNILSDIENTLPKDHLKNIDYLDFYCSKYKHVKQFDGVACAPLFDETKCVIKIYKNYRENDNHFKSVLIHEIGHTIFPKYQKRFVSLIKYNYRINERFVNKLDSVCYRLLRSGYGLDELEHELFAYGYANKFFYHTNGLLEKLVSKTIEVL